jgi:hypothetical protein
MQQVVQGEDHQPIIKRINSILIMIISAKIIGTEVRIAKIVLIKVLIKIIR